MEGADCSNGGNIPSNIGRNGQIGAEWGGKWYGGVFGWNSPDEGVRNYVLRGPPEAFGNALLLTGDQGYTQVLRRQVDNLYANKKVENGRVLLPRYYGDKGWYGHHDGESGSAGGLTNLREVETDIYLWALQAGDLERLPKRGWIGYLTSGDAAYPLTALQQGLSEIQRAASRLRADTSTPDFPPHSTRGAGVNPVATEALINLTLGANDPNGSGHGPLPLHAQVRHFDPERRRAGLAEDVAALVEKITAEGVTLTLVNTHPFAAPNGDNPGGRVWRTSRDQRRRGRPHRYHGRSLFHRAAGARCRRHADDQPSTVRASTDNGISVGSEELTQELETTNYNLRAES